LGTRDTQPMTISQHGSGQTAALADPVAVVGMGCRFPGGVSGAEEFWELLAGGRSGITEVPPDRWDVAEFFAADPDAPGRTYSRHGGFIEGVRDFDAALFGISPREAAGIDPQHRMVLEVAWEALEHAGTAPDSLRGSATGVFVGMGGSDYERLNLSTGDVTTVDSHTVTGAAGNMAANRLSYVLGLEGPSLVVDTACSSSLVAVHLAVQALRSGECDTALAGGVNLLLSPGTTIALSKARMLSPDGQCKTFDAAADGYVRGEGCGMIVLRRLADAQRDRQRAWAVIKGSAVNQDGRSNGLTAPRGAAQEQVVRRAVRAAGVDPRDIGYVETHGTGTALGDPIEVRALNTALNAGRDPRHPLSLGAVKTNIGHLEAAAGIAGLIKTVLTLHHATIPPTLNITNPSPHIPWDQIPVRVPREPTPWPQPCRTAGISSFGFGGTNAHLILQTPPPEPGPEAAPAPGTGPVLVKITGHGTDAVQAGARRLAAWIRDRAEPGTSLPALAWAAGTGRAELPDRAAVIAGTPDELIAGLEAIAHGRPAPGTASGHRPGTPPRIAFTVPGQGIRLAGALADTYGRHPAITRTIDTIASALGPAADQPLTLLTTPPATDTHPHDTAESALARFAMTIAIANWWESAGVQPDTIYCTAGGAYSAAVLAGMCTLTDGALLAAADDRKRPPGTLLAKLQPPRPGIEVVPAPGDLRQSTLENWLRAIDQARAAPQPTGAAGSRGNDVTIELGAENKRDLLETAARAWTAGVAVNWAEINGPRPAVVPALPKYPFQRRPHWPPHAYPGTALAHPVPDGDGTGLRPRITRSAVGHTIGETQLSLQLVPFLGEHRVHGRLVVPGVVFLELVLRTAAAVLGPSASAQELVVSRSLVLGDADTATVQVVIDRPSAGRARARVFSHGISQDWHEHFAATLYSEAPAVPVPDEAFTVARDRCAQVIAGQDFYRQAWHPLFRLGPSFTLVRAARLGPQAIAGTVVPPPAGALGVSAGVRPELLLLDASIQLVAVAAQGGPAFGDHPVHLGTGYEWGTAGDINRFDELECVAVLRETRDDLVLGDLRLFGPDGQQVAAIQGASFRPVAPQMLARILVGSPGGADTAPTRPAPELARLRGASQAERQKVIVDHLAYLLATILDTTEESLERDVPLTDLADSLMTTELRVSIDREFGVSVPAEVMFDVGTLADLGDWIIARWPAGNTRAETENPEVESESRQQPPTAGPPQYQRDRPRKFGRTVTVMTVPEMEAYAELEATITATGDPEPAGVAPQATLLTGSTGFVGAFLLDELLKRGACDVHCLVRADNPEHAIHRVLDNLRRYGIDEGPHRSRIIPVVGDLAKPRLGLDERAFAELHDKVGGIVHCGALVKWTYPYRQLESANVSGTREVLRLATAGAPRPVHFISTVGVFSSRDYAADTVDEHADIRESGSLIVGYAQTKWVSERMVRIAQARGLPASIHRINTGGHSQTGAFNRMDHLTMVIKGCVETGLAPDDLADMPVQPAPVDYVAAAVAEVSQRPELSGRTFHLANQRAMNWKQLFDCVEEFGYPLKRIPRGEWRDLVTRGSAKSTALLALAPFLHESLDRARLPLFQTEITQSLLEPHGLRCPRLDSTLVHTFLQGFVDSGLISPPTT
jgi:thioester reductase-like protein